MMTRKRILTYLAVGILMIFITLAASGYASAQTVSGFDLSWNVTGAGGGAMTGSGFRMDSTLGQTAVNPSSGSGLTLSAGFWQDLLVRNLQFMPMIKK
jgi:hypothetical protein